MNWLLCVCVLLFVVFALLGWHDGFVKTCFRLVSLAIALALAAMISPPIANQMMKQAAFSEKITEGVSEVLNLDKLGEKVEITHVDIDGLSLPDPIKQQILKFNDSDGFSKLAAETAAEYVSTLVATIVVRALCFVIVFTIVAIILFLATNALNLVVRIAGLSTVNKIGGLLLGLLMALVIVFVLFALITATANTGWGQSCMACINESKFLKTLYDYNIINGAFIDLATKMR